MTIVSIVPCHTLRKFLFGFILLHLVSGALSKESAPEIIEHPQSAIVIRNRPHTLRCRADGDPSPTYRWYKDDRPLLPSSHYTTLDNGALFFLRVAQSRSQQDTGVYVCVATNYLGSDFSQNATLDVAYMREDFRKVSDDLVASSGDQLQMECTPPRANPTPNVTWEKDGQPLVLSARRRLQDGNLLFTQVRSVDEGEYVCTATNMADTKRTRAIVLQVTEGPDFLIVPEDTVATVGETVKLECQADGQPLPVISWSRLESPISSDSVTVLEDSSIRIRDATLADSGTYICTAESSVGKKTKQATIKIVTSIDFLAEPADVTVKENSVTSFQCVANGNPKPTVFWQKDGVGDLFMFPGQNYIRYSVLDDGTLTIVRVQTSDEGRYTCSAVGQSTVSTSAYLTVVAMVNRYPPIIDIGVVNQTLTVGENAMLPCEVVSTDQTNILWLKNSAPISRNDRITQLDSGTLQISALHSSDSALYTCVASRSSYQTIWNATLLVIGTNEIEKIEIRKMPPEKDLPSSPRQLIVSNITGSSVLLSWQPPDSNGGSNINYYRLEYFIDDSLQVGWMVLLDRIATSSIHVYNLKHLTTYRFIVRAADAQGFGKPSEVTEPITTLDSGVTPPPRVTLPVSPQQKLNTAGVSIVEVQVLSSTAVKLIWQVARNQEYIEGFYVSYRKVLEQPVVEAVRDVSMLLITELTAATPYSFSIKPFHQQNIGSETPPFTISTLEHGTELPIEIGGDDVLQDKLNQCGIRLRSVDPVGTHSFKVLWRLQNDECKDYVDGYHIKYYKDNINNRYNTKTVKKSRMATVHYLEADCTYLVSVVPFNGKQQGKGSDVKEVQLSNSGFFTSSVNENTPGSLDGLPIGVRVHVKSSDTISVEWKPPVITHDVIVDYLVMCLGNNSYYHRNITTENNLTFYVTFTDLEPGMTYTILVAARIHDRGAATRNMVRIGPPSTVTIQLSQDPVILNNTNNENIVTSPLFIGILGGVITILAIVILTFWFLKQKRKKKQSLGSKACDGDGNCSVYKPAVSQVSAKGQEGQWNSHSWQRTQVDNQEYTVNTYGFRSNCDHPVPHDCTRSNTWSSTAHSTMDTFHRRMQQTAHGPEYAVVEKSESPSCSLHGIHVLMPSNSKEDPLNIEPYASTSLIQARYIQQQQQQQQQAKRFSENSINRAGPKAPWHGELINNGYSSSDGSGALPPPPPPPVPDRYIMERMQLLPAGVFVKPVETNSCTPYQMRAASPCNTCQKPPRPAVHITTNPLASRNLTFHDGIPHLPYQPADMNAERSPTPPTRQWALSSADSCSDNNPSPPCDQPMPRCRMSGSPDPYTSQLNDLSSLQAYQVSPMQQSLPLQKYLTQQQELHIQEQQRLQEQQPTCPSPDHDSEEFPRVELDAISICTDSIVTSCTSGSSSSMRHSRASLESEGSYFSDIPNLTSIPQILTDKSPSGSKSSSSIT